MFFTPEYLSQHRRLQGHWDELWANRDTFNRAQTDMVERYRPTMTANQLAANVNGLTQDFWAEIDRQVIEIRDITTGMEIVTDLLQVQTPLPIGKTAKLYNIVGDIADDVQISLDGQPPYSFDHVDYASDGDPIPVFTAGYGVNWRHAAGLNTVGIDLVLDSQRAKLIKYHKALVSYVLDGSAKIQVEGYPGEGIRNHRNTVPIDLSTASSTNGLLNLTTADQEALALFFTTGPFGATARANFVDAYDVLWVSPEIWGNLMRPATVTIGGGNVLTGGTVLSVITPFMPVREVKQTFALSGNEFIAYQRRRDVITPLVGMATGIVPLPRPLPQTNYNFQIMGAMGLQIGVDADGRGGVVYGAAL